MLSRRSQWFNADRTKRLARDDKSSPEYIPETVAPGAYSPPTTFGQFFQLKRFGEMNKTELKKTLQALNFSANLQTHTKFSSMYS